MSAFVQRTICVILLCIASACAPIRGFPDDPADHSDLSIYYGPASELEYDAAKDDAGRIAARERIVRHRLYGYDLVFSDFKRRLTADGNIVSAGGSLAALALGGVAATTGNLATSGALAAAGAGIVGAQAVVNKDLYFQKTIPALLADMDAARGLVTAAILTGLTQPISSYPLVAANADLHRLKDAGSIEVAINSINQQASAAKMEAEDKITFARSPDYLMTQGSVNSVADRIRSLTDTQVLKLANSMVPALAQASPPAQKVAKPYIPAAGTFTAAQAIRARRFVSFWVQADTMTPPRLATWNAAINAAEKP